MATATPPPPTSMCCRSSPSTPRRTTSPSAPARRRLTNGLVLRVVQDAAVGAENVGEASKEGSKVRGRENGSRTGRCRTRP
eukprot:2947077-Rhodomonas_salina.1